MFKLKQKEINARKLKQKQTPTFNFKVKTTKLKQKAQTKDMIINYLISDESCFSDVIFFFHKI